MTTTILAAGRPLTLLAEKAAFLAASRHAAVADAHIGKAVSFRALGVPVPRGTTSETLAALSALIATWRARRVVFLGDFLHSARSHAPATLGAVARWRARARRRSSSSSCAATTTTAPATRRRTSACASSTSRSSSTASRSAITRGRAAAPTCSPATCIRASASAGAASTTCACRASGSATTSACCPRSAPSPACTRSAPAPSDRVFAIADGAVAAMRSRAVAAAGDAAPPDRDGVRPAPLLALVARAEALARPPRGACCRIRSTAPDWNASIGVSLPQARRHRRPARAGAPRRADPPRGRWSRSSAQKERMLRNTEQFVAGKAANNVLLTGARGTGKSSLIKACLNEFAARGLRLIEVDKSDLVDLPDIVDLVADRARALRRLLRRPELRRGRARLQGAEVDPRRLGRREHRQRADLRHQQPAPPAARVHEGEPQLSPHRGRRGPSRAR